MRPVGRTAWAKSLPCWTAFWPDAAVEHQKGLVRRARRLPPMTRTTLPQLLHQAFLGVQPPGGVDDGRRHAPRLRRLDGVERHRGGVAARRAR